LENRPIALRIEASDSYSVTPMLNLSEILLKHGENISSFEELKDIIVKEALETGQMYLNLDIEPPAYDDRPQDWYDQLEMTFSSAR